MRRGNVYASEKGILMRDGREIPSREREEGRGGEEGRKKKRVVREKKE